MEHEYLEKPEKHQTGIQPTGTGFYYDKINRLVLISDCIDNNHKFMFI